MYPMTGVIIRCKCFGPHGKSAYKNYLVLLYYYYYIKTDMYTYNFIQINAWIPEALFFLPSVLFKIPFIFFLFPSYSLLHNLHITLNNLNFVWKPWNTLLAMQLEVFADPDLLNMNITDYKDSMKMHTCILFDVYVHLHTCMLGKVTHKMLPTSLRPLCWPWVFEFKLLLPGESTGNSGKEHLFFQSCISRSHRTTHRRRNL